MIILTPQDRIPVKIDDATFWISPLTQADKLRIAELAIKAQGSEEIEDRLALIKCYFKYSIKGLDGVKRPDGKKYKLEFEENGHLNDDCVEALLSLGAYNQLFSVCVELHRGASVFEVEGVEVDLSKIKTVKKK